MYFLCRYFASVSNKFYQQHQKYFFFFVTHTNLFQTQPRYFKNVFVFILKNKNRFIGKFRFGRWAICKTRMSKFLWTNLRTEENSIVYSLLKQVFHFYIPHFRFFTRVLCILVRNYRRQLSRSKTNSKWFYFKNPNGDIMVNGERR